MTTGICDRLVQDPLNFVDASYDQAFLLDAAERDRIQLAGLQRRFDALRERVPVLCKLAAEQGIERIERIDDVVPLLFPHTVYKSYPLSVLERGDFQRLTRWLDGLTRYDLSRFDASGLESIDAWIGRLDATTDLRILHTFGTSGKLSFMPRTAEQWVQANHITAHCIRDWHGPDSGPDLLVERLPMVQPGYRHGAGATYRGVELMVKLWAGGDDNALFLYPDDYFSADIASLAGRLRAAEARGVQGGLELSPALLARRDEFAARERQRPERMKEFIRTAIQRYGGRNICLFAVWPILFEWAEEGLAAGIRRAFGEGSQLISGGGSKGRVLPEDYRAQISEFLGFDRVIEFYGMSELMVNSPRCEAGNYHVPPVVVPFVLDPQTGTPLPRSGLQTGRFAVFDLLPDSYWGGLVTGDQVTMGGWEHPCDCGRQGVYVHADIRRFGEMQGGDDKINCAGAPEAHDRAVEFLLNH